MKCMLNLPEISEKIQCLALLSKYLWTSPPIGACITLTGLHIMWFYKNRLGLRETGFSCSLFKHLEFKIDTFCVYNISGFN